MISEILFYWRRSRQDRAAAREREAYLRQHRWQEPKAAGRRMSRRQARRVTVWAGYRN